MTQYDTVSFFAFVLIVSVFAATCLWNFAVRKTPLKPVSLRSGLLFVLSWSFFTISVLVVIEAFRNTLQPGIWAEEQLFRGFEFEKNMTGLQGSPMLLFYGWILFPLRNLPLVEISWEGIAVGGFAVLIALIATELFGRFTLKHRWQSRWTVVGLCGFVLLYAMTYSSVALTRQIFWLVFF